ncbi:MAG TPA: hypothetical protein DCQ94_06820 [Nitrospira sp.]|nr:hypothetical protein [Nitrospira sp.]
MPAHAIDITWKQGNDTVQNTVVVAGLQELNLGDTESPWTVPHEATADRKTVSIDVSQLKSLFLTSTRDVTVKTNSTGSPDNTIELKAGKPAIWWENCGWDCQLTVDVTDFYVANASGQSATIQLRTILEPATA